MAGAYLEVLSASPFTGLIDSRDNSSSQFFFKRCVQLKQGMAAVGAEVAVFYPFLYSTKVAHFQLKKMTAVNECFAIAAELKKDGGMCMYVKC